MSTRRNKKFGGGTRKAPKAHASDTELGRVVYMKGKDEQPWIVEAAGKSQRWNKATGYFTHDNGGRPFYVKIRDGKVTVLRGLCDDKCASNKNVGYIYNKHVLTISSYKKVWIGENTGKYSNKYEIKGKGNSILVHISGNRYVYIGDHIFEFTTSDTIKEFHGIVGNSDVIYAFAIGEANTYFFIDDAYLPNAVLPTDVDPYPTYFEHKDSAKKLKGKMIAKRIF
jgi:hypothetical protein